eukprot:Skav207760  [mRNA]  locus=scaffold181:253266:281559:+ [translate_table: standard]
MVTNVGAVGELSCRVTAAEIEATQQSYSLTGCQLDPGQIYALYVYVEDHRFNTDGTLSRTVFVKVIRSNNFAVSPVLVTLPTLNGFDVRFQATVAGRAWAMAVDAIGGSGEGKSLLPAERGVTSLSIRSLQGALGGPQCYFQDVTIDACPESAADSYQSQTLLTFCCFRPMIASFFDGSNISADEASSDLSPVLIVEDIPIVSNWINVFTVETAKFMDLNPDTVGQADCRKNDVSMGTGETLVELTNCDLVLSGAGITFYAAFVYVPWNSAQPSFHSTEVLNISNTFLWPFPRIAAFDTNGTLSVEVFPRNSGRIWARIVFASLYSSVERWNGDLNQDVLKNWQSYPDNGPHLCCDAGIGTNNRVKHFVIVICILLFSFYSSQAATWLNFSNCTFDPRTDYLPLVLTLRIGIFVEDFGNNNDGDISSIRVMKLADASNYFLVSPRLLGTAYADNFTMEYRTANAGSQCFAWCAIVLPEMVPSVPGAAVMKKAETVFGGGPTCCQSSTPITTIANNLEQWPLTNCALSMDTEYVFLMYISAGGLDGTLSSGYTFKTFGTLGHIRCLKVTLAGRNLAGWSSLSEPLITGCFLRPGSISNLREVASYQLSADQAALALAWDAPPDSVGADSAYYNVYRDQGLRQASFQLVGTTQTPFFNDTNLAAGRAYGYQALDLAGNTGEEDPCEETRLVISVGVPCQRKNLEGGLPGSSYGIAIMTTTAVGLLARAKRSKRSVASRAQGGDMSVSMEEVRAAQRAWAETIKKISKIYLSGGDYVAEATKAAGELYGYGHGNVLFKPTKAKDVQFRPEAAQALSYFVGADAIPGGIPEDHGFAINGGKGWSDVMFDNHQIDFHGNVAIAMGNYYFSSAGDGSISKVEYTFGYRKCQDGKVRICLHHSSIPYHGAASVSVEEVKAAQRAWADAIINISRVCLQGGDYVAVAAEAAGELYGYGHGNVLFKPTKAADVQFRPEAGQAMSYFVGADAVTGGIPEDHGFAINGGKGWSDAGVHLTCRTVNCIFLTSVYP